MCLLVKTIGLDWIKLIQFILKESKEVTLKENYFYIFRCAACGKDPKQILDIFRCMVLSWNYSFMKIKFFLLTFLVLFSRGCDFYSTSLWFFDNPTGETNPLYRYFGVGWSGLIFTNVIIVGLIIYAFYYYSFKYSHLMKVSKPDKLTDFVSEMYFNEKGRFLEIFYTR